MSDAPQEMVGPFGCQRTLLTHTKFAVNLIHFCGAALQPLVPNSILICGVTLSLVGIQLNPIYRSLKRTGPEMEPQ